MTSMRTNCRHYESRSYAGGETVRKCRLDLAPDAPWKCPEDCVAFEKRMMDVGWAYGSLTSGVSAPPQAPQSEDAAALLDEAESIVNAAMSEVAAEMQAAEAKRRKRRRKKK